MFTGLRVFAVNWQFTFTPIQLLLGSVGGSIAVIANFLAVMMVGKVNERTPEGKRISYLWWNRSVVGRYRQLYPKGRLALLFRAAEVALALWFLVAAFVVLR